MGLKIPYFFFGGGRNIRNRIEIMSNYISAVRNLQLSVGNATVYLPTFLTNNFNSSVIATFRDECKRSQNTYSLTYLLNHFNFTHYQIRMQIKDVRIVVDGSSCGPGSTKCFRSGYVDGCGS